MWLILSSLLTLNDVGPNDHTIAQIKDAVRDGLRAVKNTIEDEAVVLVNSVLFMIFSEIWFDSFLGWRLSMIHFFFPVLVQMVKKWVALGCVVGLNFSNFLADIRIFVLYIFSIEVPNCFSGGRSF